MLQQHSTTLDKYDCITALRYFTRKPRIFRTAQDAQANSCRRGAGSESSTESEKSTTISRSLLYQIDWQADRSKTDQRCIATGHCRTIFVLDTVEKCENTSCVGVSCHGALSLRIPTFWLKNHFLRSRTHEFLPEPASFLPVPDLSRGP